MGLKMKRKNKFTYLNIFVPLSLITSEILSILIGFCVLSVHVLIVLLSTPIYLYRFVLSRTAKYINPNLGNIVDARGHFFAVDQFTSPKKSPRSNVVVAVTLDGYVPIQRIQDNFQDNFVNCLKEGTGKYRHPEAKQFVKSFLGFKFWCNEDNFKIENHVKVVNICKNPTVSSEELRDYTECLLNLPFYPTRSPWECLVIHNYSSSDCENSTVLIFRFHHCLCDLYGALFSIFAKISSKPVTNLPVPNFHQEKTSFRVVLSQLTFPIRAIRDIWKFVLLSLEDSPWKIEDDKKAWKLLFQSSTEIPVKYLKDIKSRFDVSFVSVVHSCLAAAMENLLVAQYGDKKAKLCPATASIMILPIQGHPHTLTNYNTGAFLHLPTRPIDSLQRLQECNNDQIVIRNSTIPVVAKCLHILAGSMVSSLAQVMGKNRSFPVSLSNFPFGGGFEICSQQVTHLVAASGPAPGVAGLGITIYTYANYLQIGMVGEASLFSKEDLELLGKYFNEEIYTLHNLAVNCNLI